MSPTSFRVSKVRRALIAGVLLLAAVAVSIPEPVKADPPPWAPAWGYRNKHAKKNKNKHDSEPVVVQQQPPFHIPYGIDLGRCNRTEIGVAIGAATGAAVGSQVTDKDDRAVGIIGDLIVGGVV